MVNEIRFENRSFELIKDGQFNPNENIYSIIVGKNGTGKSTLLKSLVVELLESQSNIFLGGHELLSNANPKAFIRKDKRPVNIIAVSSSPFDKFPITKKYNDIANYTYLGLRDLSSYNFALSYMTKIISSLIGNIHRTPDHWNHLTEVLNYLGYGEDISVKFSIILPKSVLIAFLQNPDFDPKILFDDGYISQRSLNKRFFSDETGKLDNRKLIRFKELIIAFMQYHQNFNDLGRFFQLNINQNGIFSAANNSQYENYEIEFLINSGLFRLKDVLLTKKKSIQKFSIKGSSSGEQSVILSILGIASKITDNSIICIDEPEVCLHPEWQEKYIQLLINTFSKYKECHFIIATHSPQIVSNLSPNNCFIISMDDGQINNASQFLNNSIDFQLANLFKTPGFKNEYLSRIAFTIFSKVGKNKKFDPDDLLNFKILKDLNKTLNANDPLKDLISVIIELHKKYA